MRFYLSLLLVLVFLAITFRCSLLLLILDFVGCFHLMIALLVLIFVAEKIKIETRLKCQSFHCDIKIIEIMASFHPETAKPHKRHKRAAIFLVLPIDLSRVAWI